MDLRQMISRSSSLVVIDIETTGINPFMNDVLSVALVSLNSNAEPLEIHVNPGPTNWNKIAAANFERFRQVWEETAVEPTAACEAIEKYIKRWWPGVAVTPVGHNIGFDVAFLRKLAFQGGREQLSMVSHRALDTHTLLYLLYLKGELPENALSSDGALKYFGIEVSADKRHTALGDALATRSLLFRLLEMFELDLGDTWPLTALGRHYSQKD
jgi:DNA polymerase III subunit epsilon